MIGTDALKIPFGTTSQRPTGDSAYYRFNKDSMTNELHDGGAWQAMATRNWVRSNGGVFRKYTASLSPGMAGSSILFTRDAGGGQLLFECHQRQRVRRCRAGFCYRLLPVALRWKASMEVTDTGRKEVGGGGYKPYIAAWIYRIIPM
ncbi:MAG: hypothetical protein JST42_30110 [Bacteroidetes bacterium]|nr:hypothetical protein [Bacteroidota bacterium]